MEKKIVYVKLLSGEELITTHVKTDSDTFTFEKTIQIGFVSAQAPNQQPKLGFMPFLPYTKATERVAINKSSVTLMSDPDASLTAAYQKATGGIITPKTGLIVP